MSASGSETDRELVRERAGYTSGRGVDMIGSLGIVGIGTGSGDSLYGVNDALTLRGWWWISAGQETGDNTINPS